MENENNGCLDAIGKMALLLVIGIWLGILRAWVFTWCWLWFVVPLGLPMIGVAHAWGFGVMFELARLNRDNDERVLTGEEGTFASRFADAIVKSLVNSMFGFGIAYILSHYV